ncbi:malate synthase A [Legionella sp. W05-934-2]|uniref:malate synthase A n=1 Tax=Legionella sp. W05-934-2 TaxID=1198649 RepID=UPI0034625A2A
MYQASTELEKSILTEECQAFIEGLNQTIYHDRQRCLNFRQTFQDKIDNGHLPDFIPETKAIRDDEWQAAPIPEEVLDRRVEITGPVDRKMIINALNSGAKVFMADFEDSNSPTWKNCLEGQLNLIDAVKRTIRYDDPKSGKHYQLNDTVATLMVRPRGWHLQEAHFLCDGEPISASVFDAGIFLYFNAKTLLDQGKLPYLYLPKIEHYHEAQLWHTVLSRAESDLGLPPNCIKVTVLIETISAVFEMNEIIHALKDRILGLNCGRWDYIFSYIKQLHHDKQFVLPNRNDVTMTTPFLKAYVDLLVYTCHRRGIHAMGGMAAQIPIKNDEEANKAAIAKVKADKLREVKAGHDGTWVAHPGLVNLALTIFREHMEGVNQIQYLPKKPDIGQRELLQAPKGPVTEAGVRNNISVALNYLRSWLAGNGCVPVNFLMEDAATAEICRSQLWQWRQWGTALDNGSTVNKTYLQTCIDQESAIIESQLNDNGEANHLFTAKQLLIDLVFSETFPEFLTLEAYPLLG